MKKLVHGVGVNDADYVVCPRINNLCVFCPFYQTWHGMLTRCYSVKYQAKFPTYIGCTVCKEWHSFMAFRAWMMAQDWQGKQLDKDLLVHGNKFYSPEACIFVSSQINKLLCDSGSARGNWPIGVNWHVRVNKFQANCSMKGKSRSLGYFYDPHSAHRAWQARKIEAIKQATAIENNVRLLAALNKILTKLQEDFDNNLETK